MISENRQKQTGLWFRFLHLQRQFESSKGLLVMIWAIRFGALLGLSAYFVIYRDRYSPQALALTRVALFTFFAYVLAMGVAGVFRLEWFLLHWVKLGQVVIELGLYSIFYCLTQDPRSEVFFLYFLPLFVAFRYLRTAWALFVLALACLSLYGAIHFAAGLSNGYSVLEIYVYRALFMVFMTLFYAFRRRPSVLEDVKAESSHLISVLSTLDDGVFVVDNEGQLLFANDVLQARHGPCAVGQSYTSYFQCPDQLAVWCVASESEPNISSFTDQDGHDYQVEISCRAISDEAGQVVGSIGFVQDVSRQRQVERQLGDRLRGYAQRVQDLTSERAKWLDTYTAMGKRLTGYGNIQELMSFLVDETSQRLKSETSSLFLLRDDRLVRTAIAGVEDDWFAEEDYRIGEGITGRVLIPREGAHHGEPVLSNAVAKDSRVVQEHLRRYEEKLPSHEVRHLIAVPLNGREGSFGVLRVLNKLDRWGKLSEPGFMQEDVEFLGAIASMVAIAIENARLLGETVQRLQESETLHSVANRITQSWNLQELLQIIVDEAQQTIPNVDKAIVHLVDARTGILVPKAVPESLALPSGLPSLRYYEGIAGRAIAEKAVIHVSDTREDPNFQSGGPAALSLMVAPLIADGIVVGALGVDSSQANVFTAGDQRVLTTVAADAAMAIRKTHHLEQEQEKRQLADTLREVSRIANSTLELEEVLDCTLEELSRVIDFHSSSIQIAEQDHLRIIACRGFGDPKGVMQLSFPIDNPHFPNYEVMKGEKPFIVKDVRTEYVHFEEEAEKYHSMQIRSWLGVPLIHRDEVIGMIALDSEIPGDFTDEDASLALTFANQVAMAIQNARLFEETERKIQELNTLFRASQVVTSSLDLHRVLETIVSLAGEVADSDYTSVVLLNEDDELYISVEDPAVGDPLHLRARDEGITRAVVNSGEPRFFSDVEDDGVTHNPAIIKQRFRSYGGVPIISRGKVLGVLFVHSRRARAFEGRVQLLSTFCNHAAIAIDHAQLFSEAEQQANTLGSLVEVSQRLIQHTGRDELLEFCAKSGARLFDVEDCSISVLSDERQTVDLVASSGIPAHVWPKREAHIEGPGLTAYVVRTGKTLNFGGNAFKEHAEWSGEFLEHLGFLPSKRCHSLLLGPLEDSRGKCVGILKLENRRGDGADKPFTEFQLAMHKTLASQIGIALERAELYHRLHEEARQKARESLSDDLHDIMNVQHGALVLQTAYIQELMGREKYAKATDELGMLAKAARTVHEGIRRVRDDVRDPILQERGLAQALKHYAKMMRISVQFETTGRTSIPPGIEYGLYKIGQEALNNAFKHARLAETGGDVQAVLDRSESGFRLLIRDSGVGFDPGTTLKRSDAFGFQSMSRWATSVGAQLEIISEPGRGTCIDVQGCLSGGGAA